MKPKYFFKIVLFSLLVFGMNMPFVMAKDSIEIEDIKVIDKSDSITVEDFSFHNNEILSSIEFNRKDDFVTLELTLKNNSETDYQLNSVLNQIEEDYLTVEINEKDKLIQKNSESKVTLTIKYDKGLHIQDKWVVDDGLLTLNFIEVKNPFTGTNITLIALLVILSAVSIYLIVKKKKGIAIIILLVPMLVMAEEKTSVTIEFHNVTINKYEFHVVFNDNSNLFGSYVYEVGDIIGELPITSKDGYTFNGWKTEEGELVDSTFVITKDMVLIADYTIINYNISYNLSGGTLTTQNPTSYTVEDTFTLNNPTKIGYTFIGWTTETNTTPEQNITIVRGTTGNITYTANFTEQQTTTTYTVIHRQMNLEGVYEETSREIKDGIVGCSVTPETNSYEGFTSPSKQTKTIGANGLTTFIYDYERNKYRYRYSSYIVESSHPEGEYYYGTEISVTAASKNSVGEPFSYMTLSSQNSSRNVFARTTTFTLTGNTSVFVTFCLSGEMEVEVYDKKKKKKRKKKLKDVGPDDLLLAWDFDNGCYDYVEPSFIMKKTKAYEHHILRFDDGSELDVVGEHRMYDVDRNMFVDCIADSPIGTRTITKDGKIVTLISKQKMNTEVDVCRVITKKHFNFFANGILTSIVLNNLYPIQDMKYIKEERNAIHKEDLNTDEYTFKELRFSEIDEKFKGYLESTQSFLNYYSGVLNNGDYERNEKE